LNKVPFKKDEPLKFIHAADLHVDSPLRGLDSYDGAPVDRLRGATRHALMALVDLALEQKVDLVILAGDIYDGNWADFRTGLFFREQMLRMTRTGIRVFIVKGNHDAASQITKQLPAVDGVHVFSALKSETIALDELGVALHGRSFPDRDVTEDLVPNYPDAVAGKFNIGILHTSLTGRAGHDLYAPTTVDKLNSKGYDYFALGHVHAREIVQEVDPRIVYPGNLQGRHAKETGPKGCELVTVAGGRISNAAFVALDVVRWHQLTIDVTGVLNLDDLARLFIQRATAIAAGAPDRLHAVRVHLEGESVLQVVEARQPGSLGAAIQAAAQEIDNGDLWVEEIRLDLRSPIDRGTLAERLDAVGEVVRIVDSLAADDVQLKSWFAQQVGELTALPAGFGDGDPIAFTLADMRAILADAEASVLVQLQGSASAGDAR
jgi:exonuclease SbcD